MDTTVLAICGGVYFGMIPGRIPGLALDRTGIALLGAYLCIAFGKLSPQEVWDAMDVPAIGLRFGLMVVSAQFRLGGFYTAVTRKAAESALSPATLLAAEMAAAGLAIARWIVARLYREGWVREIAPPRSKHLVSMDGRARKISSSRTCPR